MALPGTLPSSLLFLLPLLSLFLPPSPPLPLLPRHLLSSLCPLSPLSSSFQLTLHLIKQLLITGTASGPAVTRSNQLTDKKRDQCKAVVDQVFALLEAKLHTRQIMTREVLLFLHVPERNFQWAKLLYLLSTCRRLRMPLLLCTLLVAPLTVCYIFLP